LDIGIDILDLRTLDFRFQFPAVAINFQLHTSVLEKNTFNCVSAVELGEGRGAQAGEFDIGIKLVF
jgi:hypothetical protein